MSFDYHEPQTLSEAFQILAVQGESAALLAGGTDLLLQMRRRLRSYRSVVNIKAIAELSAILAISDGGLECGALVTFRRIETNATVAAVFPSLREAARVVAGVQLRNLATIGGNVANASPSADGVPPLVALGAMASIRGPRGSRTLPLEECITGPGKTVLAPDEIFTGFTIPTPASRSGNAYQRFTPRSAMDIAVVSVGVMVELDDGGTCTGCRIALGAVSPAPLRARRAEAALQGERFTPGLLAHAGELAAAEAHPISDIRGSAGYRMAIVRTLTARVIESAAQRASAYAHPNGSTRA